MQSSPKIVELWLLFWSRVVKIRESLTIALDWLVPIGIVALIYITLPVRTALQFGCDEGFELMKAFLVSHGHPLYSEIWNDQPPLHTEMLAIMFRLFGPSAFVGRLLSLAFTTVLVGAFFRQVSQQSGRVTGLVAVVLMISFSSFIQLSVSVMIELPAMALAVASRWALAKHYSGSDRRWVVISGVLFGLALQVKWTAAIYIPALVAEYLIDNITCCKRNNERPRNIRSGIWQAPIIWLMFAIGSIMLIVVACYQINTFHIFVLSHFSNATRASVASDSYRFRLDSLVNDLGVLIPASLGVTLIIWKRRWDLSFPIVLLGTVIAIHLWHRPYWYYYGMHFAIPLAWLGAVGIVEWIKELWKIRINSICSKMLTGLGLLGWSLIVALTMTLVPENIWSEVVRVSVTTTVTEDTLLLKLRNYAWRTHWIFTDKLIYAFWAGVPVPPQLAVIPLKRIWSGQITKEEIVESLERYKPELLYMPLEWETKFGLSDYLREHYQLETRELTYVCYARNNLFNTIKFKTY